MSNDFRENLKAGRRFTSRSDDGYSKALQSKGGTNSGKARAARAVFKKLIAKNPEAILSGKALDMIRDAGLDPSEKTMLELAAEATMLQWILGNVKAGQLAMEITGDDSGAEQRKISRDRLKVERERLELERQRVELERERLEDARGDRPDDMPRIIDIRPDAPRCEADE